VWLIYVKVEGESTPDHIILARNSNRELDDLANSIRGEGSIKTAIAMGKSTPGGYELIAVDRRLRSERSLGGLSEIPAIVKRIVDAGFPRNVALIENVQATVAA
jgi:ParB-like chromosome segregation protein Spo0J